MGKVVTRNAAQGKTRSSVHHVNIKSRVLGAMYTLQRTKHKPVINRNSIHAQIKRHALNPSREHSHLPLSTTKLVSNAMEQLVSDHYLVKGSAALSFDKGVHEGIKEAREKSGNASSDDERAAEDYLHHSGRPNTSRKSSKSKSRRSSTRTGKRPIRVVEVSSSSEEESAEEADELDMGLSQEVGASRKRQKLRRASTISEEEEDELAEESEEEVTKTKGKRSARKSIYSSKAAAKHTTPAALARLKKDELISRVQALEGSKEEIAEALKTRDEEITTVSEALLKIRDLEQAYKARLSKYERVEDSDEEEGEDENNQFNQFPVIVEEEVGVGSPDMGGMGHIDFGPDDDDDDDFPVAQRNNLDDSGFGAEFAAGFAGPSHSADVDPVLGSTINAVSASFDDNYHIDPITSSVHKSFSFTGGAHPPSPALSDEDRITELHQDPSSSSSVAADFSSSPSKQYPPSSLATSSGSGMTSRQLSRDTRKRRSITVVHEEEGGSRDHVEIEELMKAKRNLQEELDSMSRRYQEQTANQLEIESNEVVPDEVLSELENQEPIQVVMKHVEIATTSTPLVNSITNTEVIPVIDKSINTRIISYLNGSTSTTPISLINESTNTLLITSDDAATNTIPSVLLNKSSNTTPVDLVDASMSTDFDEMPGRYAEMEVINQRLLAEKNDLDEVILNLEKQMQVDGAELEDARELLETNRSNFILLQEELSVKETENSRLLVIASQDEVTILDLKSATLTAATEFATEVEGLRSGLAEERKERADVVGKMEEINSRFSTLVIEKATIEARVLVVEESLAATSVELGLAHEQVAQQQSMIDSLRRDLDAAIVRQESSDVENARLAASVESLEGRVVDYISAIETGQQDLEQERAKVVRVMEELKEREKAFSDLTAKAANLDSTINSLKDSATSSSIEVAIIRTQLIEERLKSKRLVGEVAQRITDSKRSEEVQKATEVVLQSTREELKDAKGKFEKVKKQYDSVMSSHEELLRKSNSAAAVSIKSQLALETMKESSEAMELKLKALEETINSKEKEASILIKSLEKEKAERKRLAGETQEKSRAITKLTTLQANVVRMLTETLVEEEEGAAVEGEKSV